MATSGISDADESMSLSSADSLEEFTPSLHVSNSRALDTSASSKILSTPTPTGIKFIPSAPQAQPPCPSDPKVVKNIEVLAAFVVKNGPEFEDMARKKQAKDPKFQFLFGGEAGSEASVACNYYEWRKNQLLSQERASSLQEPQKPNPESRNPSELLQSDSRRQSSLDASEMCNDDIGRILPSPQPKTVKEQDRFSFSTSRIDGDQSERHEQPLHLDGFNMNYSTPRRRDMRRKSGFDRQSIEDVDKLPDLLRPIQANLSPAVDKEERPLVSDNIETSSGCSESWERRRSAEMVSFTEGKQSSYRFSGGKEDIQIPQAESVSHFDANLYHKRKEATRDAERSARAVHIGKVQHTMRNAQSGPHTIDEFGRLVRQGVNDSDSDEEHNLFRKRRRSASGSRSRSPAGSRRKRQSPSWSPRWRGNYHASYSHSPKHHRSTSPTPTWEMKRGSDWGRDEGSSWRGDRGSFGRGRRGGRGGGPVQQCYDFSRGRCFRGSSCRFIHQDTRKRLGDSSGKTLGGISAHRRRENFMEHEGTYTSKDESSPSVGWGAASRTQNIADVTGGEGWNWPNDDIGGSQNQNDDIKIHEGFPTDGPENAAISGSVSAALSAETLALNTPKPSCSASMPDDSQFAPSSCSWGTNAKSQAASVQASYLSTFASQQMSPLPSTPNVSFHQHQAVPFLPPPHFPPPPPPPRLPPRLPPPTQIASFPPPMHAQGLPASLLMADHHASQTTTSSGKLFTSNVPVSWHSLSQQPVAALTVGAPPASMPTASGIVPLQQHATNATACVALPALHDSSSASLSEQSRLPSPTPSQVPFNNALSQQQGFLPHSSLPPQYIAGAVRQQEVAPSYEPSFSGMVSHQQKDGTHPPLSNHSTLGRNPPQQVLSHQFINAVTSEKTETLTTQSSSIPEYPSTSQHLSTYFSGGACTQAFTSASGAAFVTHNSHGGSESGMDDLSQSNSTGMPSSSLAHNNYLAANVKPEPAAGDLRSHILGASFDQARPSLMRSSSGIELKISGVDLEPVCPEEPMSPGPAVGGMQSVNPEPPSDLVMESVSPGLPVRVIPPDIKQGQLVTHLTGKPAVGNDTTTLKIKSNSPDNVEAHAGEHVAERTDLNLEDGSDRMKKDRDLKPVMLLRVALTEYVKEVLKPTWKEGHMSKESFKTIAKKAVDKVLGTLQSHQVPKTQDKVDHFMSFSRSKIANLVQGYVEKYVKIT